MAGRKVVKNTKRKGSRVESLAFPTQRVIPCWASANSAKMLRFDTPGLLSKANSKLYRQGRTYTVRMSLVQPTAIPNVQYSIFTLPNTWFTLGAIKYAFRNYKAAMQDELMQTGGDHARWHDFRINNSDPDGTDAEADGVLWTGANWIETPTIGDRIDSSVTSTAGTSTGFHVVGDVANSYHILKQYALYLNSRTTPPVDFAGPIGYEGLFKGADDLDNLMEQGDQPPWSVDYLGLWDSNEDGTLADASTGLAYQGTLQTDSDGAVLGTSKVFDAPLGLVYVYTSAADFKYSDADGGPEIAVEAMPGSYKGVKSSPIFRHNLVGATAKSM